MAMRDSDIDVYIKLPTGRTAVYYVTTSETIGTICRKVAEEEKVKTSQVRLKYQGKVLDRSHTVSYLGVRPETILKAEILVARQINVILKLPSDLGQTEMVFWNLDSVFDVTTRIAEFIQQESKRVVLKFSGRTIRGDTILEAGIADGTTLEVVLIEPLSSATITSSAGASSMEKADNNDPMTNEMKNEILTSFATNGKPVEVVFSFDTTGSMYSCLTEVRTKLKDCCTRLIQDIPRIRIGIIAHGDYCDACSSYVIRVLDLTSDTQALVDFVTQVPPSGGGDSPECYEWALRKAQTLDWSEESAKALVIIGDDVPHDLGYTDQNVYWKDELDVLVGMGIKVYGVQAHAGGSRNSRYFYEELAEVSGGCHLQLNHFEVITDMFLAVCYRESHDAADGALAAFVTEVEEAGRMTEERRQMFSQLQASSGKHPDAHDSTRGGRTQEGRTGQQRYVAESWWDSSLPLSRVQFEYDAANDSWRATRQDFRGSETAPSASSAIFAGLYNSTEASTSCFGQNPARNSIRRRYKKFKTSKKCSIM